MINVIYLTLLLAFLIAAWGDVLAFDTAIDKLGMSAKEWESNKYRFVPGGGFLVYFRYCIKH